MPKRIPEQELQDILEIVHARRQSAVQVDAVREALPYTLPPRTLQRRLALLVAQNRLIAEGHGRGRGYRVPVDDRVITAASPGVAHPPPAEIYPPVTPAAEAIRKSVWAPIQNRRPVGYQRAFLENYRPNVSFYLPTETRLRLHSMGRAPDAERPAGTCARTIYSRLLIDLAWNSSRLEGNTYSLLETERLLE